MNFSSIRQYLVNWKFYITRTASWLSVVNTGMIFFIVFDIDSKKVLPAIFIATIILLIFAGYLEQKFGFFREELRVSNYHHPQLKELMDDVKDIKEILEYEENNQIQKREIRY